MFLYALAAAAALSQSAPAQPPPTFRAGVETDKLDAGSECRRGLCGCRLAERRRRSQGIKKHESSNFIEDGCLGTAATFDPGCDGFPKCPSSRTRAGQFVRSVPETDG